MYLKITNNEPYIITLDSLDVQYICTNIATSMAGMKPIWNNTRKDYYEFVVVTDSESDVEPKDLTDFDGETDVSDEEADPLVPGICLNDRMQCQMCHICNINIPVMFIDEHLNSEKHRLHQQLMKTALERAARSISTTQNTKKTINNDIFYCDTCSVTVPNTFKLTHMQSKQHMISQKNHRHMKALVQLYTKSNDDIVINDDSIIKRDDKESTIDIEGLDTASMTNGALGSSKVSEIVEEGEEYVVIQPYECGQDKLLQIPIYNYHGLHRYTNTCTLCACSLSENITNHIKSYMHLLKSEKPINKHYIREIDSLNNHCIVCNVRVGTKETAKHVEDPIHKIITFSCMTKNSVKTQTKPKPNQTNSKPNQTKSEPNQTNSKPNQTDSKPNQTKSEPNQTNSKPNQKNSEPNQTKSKPNNTYCEPCKRYIDTHNYLAHTKSKQHKSNTVVKSVLKLLNDSKNDALYKTNHIIKTSNPKELKCELCKVIMPNTDLNMNEHIKTKKHKDNLLTVTKGDTINLSASVVNEHLRGDEIETPRPLVIDPEDYCGVCKVKLPQKGKIIHNLGKVHKNNLLKK